MSEQRASFEDWYEKRGHLFPTTSKEALWIVFSDGWYRRQKYDEMKRGT